MFACDEVGDVEEVVGGSLTEKAKRLGRVKRCFYLDRHNKFNP